MPTLVDLEGFEHGVDAANATATMNPALWDISANPAGISFVTGRLGDGLAVRVTKDALTTTRVGRNYTTPGTLFVFSFYFRVINPAVASNSRLIVFSADVVAFLYLSILDNFVHAQVGTGTDQVGPDVSDGLWHLADVRYNSSPATHTLDWSIDGVALTQATGAGAAASNQDQWSVGSNAVAGDATVDLDDLCISATTGDYPMGTHKVFSVVPAADGTHNAGTNIMERASDGADIGTVTAWNLLDDWPPTTGLNNADTVTSSASGAANYAEVIFGPKPDYAQQTLWGVSATVAHQSDTTGANTGISRIVDAAGATLTDIFSGDMSEITEHYTRRLIAAPTGGWTVNNFAGIKGRVGFGTLQPGAPEWLALMVSAATSDETAVPILVTARRT